MHLQDYFKQKKLKQDKNWAKVYGEQMDDMVNRKIAQKLIKMEVDTYSGPVHYIAHYAVL